MNNLQPNTSGIDCIIKEMQSDIYDSLLKKYANIQGFPRVYRLPNSGKNPIPCVYVGGVENDYREVYFDDSNSVQFCFIDDELHTTNDGILFVSGVKIVFWFNLKNIDPNIRADAEAQKQVISILNNEVYSDFSIKSIQKGVDNIFSSFNKETINKGDVHPYHLFSVNIDLPYYLSKKC